MNEGESAETAETYADPGDAALTAVLATSDAKAEAWRRLLALAEEYSAEEHVYEAVQVLYRVGAVTPSFPWMHCPAPRIPHDGTLLSAADAVRAATTLVRGDRFSEGLLDAAAVNGEMQAVLSALAAWYLSRSR